MESFVNGNRGDNVDRTPKSCWPRFAALCCTEKTVGGIFHHNVGIFGNRDSCRRWPEVDSSSANLETGLFLKLESKGYQHDLSRLMSS